MLYLSKQDTMKVVDLDSVLNTIDRVTRVQAEGKVLCSEPGTCVLSIPQPRSRYRLKACALPEIPIVGIRIIGYPLDKPEGIYSTRFVLLSDPGTGKPVALIDDHWNYSLRTAASAVIGIRFLVREGPVSVGLIGAGNLAYATVLILNHVGLLGSLTVTSRRPESREKFGSRITEEFHIPVRVVASVQEAVAHADLIITATDANRQLVEDRWIPVNGVTLCAIGLYELAPDIYKRADKIVVSRWDVTRSSRDVQSLVESGVLDEPNIYAELHDLITGGKKGREEAGETIVFRSVGLVYHDVAIAYASYLAARERGVGIELDNEMTAGEE